MENRRNNTVVIFAGYPDKMRNFIKRNPGLKSRIPFHISFNDYTVDEMVCITKIEAEKRGFEIESDAIEKDKNLLIGFAV